MVGETGFEPATFCSQSRHSTRLSYSPSIEYIYFCLINSQTVKAMQIVKKIKKISLSKSFFPFWRYQFLIKSLNKKIKPYKINREILGVGDVVFALCYSPEEKKFYLIKQFRPFYYVRKEKYKFELVGGLVDEGETLNQALKREIKEEIGVKALRLKKLTKYCPLSLNKICIGDILWITSAGGCLAMVSIDLGPPGFLLDEVMSVKSGRDCMLAAPVF